MGIGRERKENYPSKTATQVVSPLPFFPHYKATRYNNAEM